VKILVVDDEPEISDLIAEILNAAGHEAVPETDPHEGLARLAAGDIEVMILDVRMPGLEGTELYLESRRMGLNIPTILISGYGPTQDIKEAISEGALCCISKPFKVEKLLELIDAITPGTDSVDRPE